MPVLGYQQKLQVAATTGDGQEVNARGETRENTFYVQGSNGVSAGAVQIETASEAGYAGTWAPVGPPVTVPSNAETIMQVTGCFKFLRARISTNLTGGTVTVEACGS